MLTITRRGPRLSTILHFYFVRLWFDFYVIVSIKFHCPYFIPI